VKPTVCNVRPDGEVVKVLLVQPALEVQVDPRQLRPVLRDRPVGEVEQPLLPLADIVLGEPVVEVGLVVEGVRIHGSLHLAQLMLPDFSLEPNYIYIYI
jgi:hypothetical protein